MAAQGGLGDRPDKLVLVSEIVAGLRGGDPRTGTGPFDRDSVHALGLAIRAVAATMRARS
jgi:hypothetical protein